VIALDTNVLVRLLTRDDHKQAEKVRLLFEAHSEANDEFFVSDVVLAELAWTLERAYRFDRTEIGKTIKAMTENATLMFESRDVLRVAYDIFESATVGFADCLIVARAQSRGCSSLLTFDKAMRTIPQVDLL
jgi:predicted nucleic-acid-binding protein